MVFASAETLAIGFDGPPKAGTASARARTTLRPRTAYRFFIYSPRPHKGPLVDGRGRPAFHHTPRRRASRARLLSDEATLRDRQTRTALQFQPRDRGFDVFGRGFEVSRGGNDFAFVSFAQGASKGSGFDLNFEQRPLECSYKFRPVARNRCLIQLFPPRADDRDEGFRVADTLLQRLPLRCRDLSLVLHAGRVEGAGVRILRDRRFPIVAGIEGEKGDQGDDQRQAGTDREQPGPAILSDHPLQAGPQSAAPVARRRSGLLTGELMTAGSAITGALLRGGTAARAVHGRQATRARLSK